MSFAHKYLTQLHAFAERYPLPRVRALHVQTAPALRQSRGALCALELYDGALGMSYVSMDPALQGFGQRGDPLGLVGADALEVAQGYASGCVSSQTLGFAAANAITRCLFDRAGFVPEHCPDSIGGLQPQTGEHIGMIGLFKPLLATFVKSGARLTVLELNPDLAGDAGSYRVTLDPTELAGCSKVLSTCTLLLNDTLERMLASCKSASWFAMVGPSAGCLPDELFARGVTLLGGSWIQSGAGFVDALKAGDQHSAYTTKFSLTPANYPGFDSLLLRACG